jgi:hypothetical protein
MHIVWQGYAKKKGHNQLKIRNGSLDKVFTPSFYNKSIILSNSRVFSLLRGSLVQHPRNYLIG